MLKKTITYTDFNGNERTEDFYFNLTRAEMLDYEHSKKGGVSDHLNKIILNNDETSLLREFRKLVDLSYGVKSDDGRQFIKNKEVLNEFKNTEAYSIIYTELATNEEAAIEFVNGIVPAKMSSNTSKNTA